MSFISGTGAGLPQEEKEKARLQAVTDGNVRVALAMQGCMDTRLRT